MEAPEYEGKCQSCLQEYYTPWSTDNETWNAVVGKENHDNGMVQFLCPNCFLNWAKVAGEEGCVYVTFNTDQEQRIAELTSALTEKEKKCDQLRALYEDAKEQLSYMQNAALTTEGEKGEDGQ